MLTLVWNLFIEACAKGDNLLVEKLLHRKAKFNTPDASGLVSISGIPSARAHHVVAFLEMDTLFLITCLHVVKLDSNSTPFTLQLLGWMEKKAPRRKTNDDWNASSCCLERALRFQ